MQKYTEINENTEIEASRQLLIDNDMTAITSSSGVDFPTYGLTGTPCYRADQDRLFIKRADGTWQMIVDAAKTALAQEDGDARYSAITHHHDTQYAARESTARPGVTRLYRSDADSGYNVQLTWTGTYWKLYGHNGDTAHAGVLVDRATSAASADDSTQLGGLTTDNWMRRNINQTFAATMTITGSLTVQTNLVVSGDITSSSDARLKTDIEPLTGALDKLMQLQGVSYRNKTTNQKNIGFIAQEIEKVIPDVVRKGADEKLSVAYGNVTALLTEAIKELVGRVEQLEASA